MWRLVLLGGLLGACGFQIATGVGPSDDVPPRDGDAIDVPTHWLPGYTHRKRIEVTSGQAITFDDFVVGILVATDVDLAAHARDDGQDLTITTVDDAILEYELERFDGGNGALVIWVRVPQLAPQTSLYLYYGGDVRLHDPHATWSPQTFRAVWHLSDALAGSAHDSAGQHDLASSSSTSTPVIQEGIAAFARTFDGNDSLRDDADDDTLDFGLTSFAYSVWVYVVSSAGSYDMPMYKGGASATTPGFDIELGTDNWTMYIGDGTRNRPVTISNETVNAWVHITGVVDRTTQTLFGYKNGVEIDKESISDVGSVSSTNTFVIGSSTGGNYWFRGRVDEPRVYARALSAEWIAAEDANLRSPSTFASTGAEEMAP